MLNNFFQWLQNNLVSMILALILALTVWVTANQEENPVEEADFTSPVEIDVTGLQSGLIITNSYSNTTQIRLRAQRNTWLVLSPEDIQVTADLSSYGPGSYQVPLQIDIATQAVLVSANPTSINVVIEEDRERTLPIQLDISGQPSVGYLDQDPEIDSETVTIRGPRSLVELVSEVRAEASIEGLRETFRDDLTLVALDSEGNRITDISITPTDIEVVVPISQEAGYRDVAVSVPTIGRPATGYYPTSITATPPLITVRGQPATIEAMQPYVETQPVDLTDLTDDLIIQVPVELPAGVTAIDTPIVEVFISIAAQLGSQALTVPITVINLSDSLEAELDTEEVEVILSGPLPVLDAMNVQEDILVTLDLENMRIGTHQLEPTIEILGQEGVSVESVFPVTVEVRIRYHPTGSD